MNAGTIPFEPAPALHMVIFVIVAIVVAVVAVIVIMYLVHVPRRPLLELADSSPSMKQYGYHTLIKQAGSV